MKVLQVDIYDESKKFSLIMIVQNPTVYVNQWTWQIVHMMYINIVYE